ncbi:hypothetical protein BHU61_06655 [Macrococcus epidermidis]|uniref:dUTPase n=1 Tax=Macrococcus epidermidis TaxID=1902580 RepID=A0A327ZVE9_9STAP|nr:dUTP diphosphatase [Macrococcus epidermidis]RAK44988.1 hypothetical protein BHU61_06655 [Macrococcus epidermidis]
MIQITLKLFEKLAKKQEELDSNIRKQHNISADEWLEDLQQNHVLALKNEIAEFQNECFDQWKYWKTKSVEPRKIIAEGVDIIHFLHLIINKHSAGKETLVTYINKRIETNMPLVRTKEEYWDKDKKKSVKIKDLRYIMNKMYQLKTLEDYLECYAILLIILDYYAFSLEEIEAAYDIKNKENHDRQQQGY